jgi:hypothetical protein
MNRYRTLLVAAGPLVLIGYLSFFAWMSVRREQFTGPRAAFEAVLQGSTGALTVEQVLGAFYIGSMSAALAVGAVASYQWLLIRISRSRDLTKVGD